jgi:hypothetical protein
MNAYNTYALGKSAATASIKPQEVANWNGKSVTVKATGNIENGYEAFNETVEVPTNIVFTNIPKDGRLFMTKFTPIEWNASGYSGPIFVELNWIKLNKEMAPGKKRSANYRLDSDKGKFVLTPEILKDFDPTGKLSISINRYSAYQIDLKKNKVGILAVVSNVAGYYYLH